MRTRGGAYLLVMWTFAAMLGQAAAQVPTTVLQESGLSRSCREDEIKVTAPSVVCLRFNRQDVVVGSSDPIPMTVTIYSPKESQITLARVSLASYEPKDGPITFEPPVEVNSGPDGVGV